jgi:phosphatidylglycerol:prolipoprotein diacylglycerol transferase
MEGARGDAWCCWRGLNSRPLPYQAGGGPDQRHPSQLYQAGLEELCLFILLMVLVYRPGVRARAGVPSGVFLGGYGVARFIGEFFRQPDAHLGFLFAGATMGQLLSLPMMAVGAWLVLRGVRRG